MPEKGRKSNMIIPTIVMGVLALILIAIAYSKGQGQHITGLQSAFKMTVQILPLLIFAFIIAGMIQVLLPQQLVSKWVGAESGFRGILIGTVFGSLTPGGPYTAMPIAAGLLQTGASIGTMVAFMTGWSLWAFTRLPIEIGLMGWKFTGIRLACTFIFPIIAGLIANVFFSKVDVL